MLRASIAAVAAMLYGNAFADDAKLTCKTDAWSALAATDFDFRQGTDVRVDVGIAREYGGVGVLLGLNGVNVLEPRSAAGGGWQTSNVIVDGSSASPTQYILFNQGAGNSRDYQWGYRNTYSGLSALEFNPLWSDNVHPYSNTATSSPTSPCAPANAYLFEHGKGQISMALGATQGHGNAVMLINQYTYQSQADQSWARWSSEQALYLSKSIAKSSNLRIYLKGKEGWIEKVDPFNINIGGKHGKRNVDANCKTNCGDNWVVPKLEYAMFVWNIRGLDVGVVVVGPDQGGSGFVGNINRVDNGFQCNDGSDQCGVIDWHTYLYDAANVSIPNGKVRTFGADYRVGTLQQLADWGYTIAAAPVCSSVALTPSSLPANGGNVSAQANCTGRGLTYAWTVDGAAYSGNQSKNSAAVGPNTSTSVKTYSVCASAKNSSGASKPVCATLTEAGAPAGATPVCSSVVLTPSSLPASGGNVSAQANCTGSSLSYVWTVDGAVYSGNQATNSSPVGANTSTSPKTYAVCVTASNSSGHSPQTCASLVEAGATATAAPVCSSITFSPTSLPASGGNVSAQANCSGSGSTYAWTIDGVAYAGTQSKNSAPVSPNTSTSPRTYSVCATATNTGGHSKVCGSLVEAGVAVATAPNCSSVTLTPNSLPASGGTVSAQANCAGTGLTYVWSVNGTTYPGNLSTNSSPVSPNTTAAPVFYAVCVTASNASGKSSTCAQLVEAAAISIAPVCSSVTLTPSSLPASGGSVSAKASCTNSGDGPYYSWFVNGAPYPAPGPASVTYQPSNSAQVPANVTASPLSYTVCVVANDSNGQSQQACSAPLVEAGAAVVLPSAPTVGSPVVVGSGAVSVPFTPGALGTGSLVSYTAGCGGTHATGTSSPIVVTGLVSGTPYFCEVKTTSTVGTGPWSAWSTTPVYP